VPGAAVPPLTAARMVRKYMICSLPEIVEQPLALAGWKSGGAGLSGGAGRTAQA